MSRRRLTPEEVDLWRKVADSAHRMHPERSRHEEPKPKPKPIKPVRPRVPEFEVGSRAQTALPRNDLLPGISERVARQPLHMDKKVYGKMKRGKMLPEGKIDLHGMTQEQAHPALTRFIQESYARGFRLVLVITGKGKDRDAPGPMPVPRGILKHQVPHWLASGPLRLLVLQVTEAHLRHGGTGAYYVYLRRHK